MNEPILVTGAAGFIGFHLARRLLSDGWTVHGLDNLNAYYDPLPKQARLLELQSSSNFHFHKCDLANREAMSALFAKNGFAQFGARAVTGFAPQTPIEEGLRKFVDWFRHFHRDLV
jgi:nucleoside-diphosphate-sugar epimerase